MKPRRRATPAEPGRRLESPDHVACVWDEAPLERAPGPVHEVDLARFSAELAGLEPRTLARAVPGRESFAWPGRPEFFVKRFVGGDVREHWYERLHGQPVRSPAQREGENLARLHAAGFPVPRPLIAVEERGAGRHPRLGARHKRSALVMEGIAHRTRLREALGAAGEETSSAALHALAELVGKLHRAGWVHRDLYLEHVVLAGGTSLEEHAFRLLDLGRARFGRALRRRWFVKDLAAIKSSLPPGTQRWFSPFLARYLEVAGHAGEDPARWARSVERKERALLAHAPRHVFPAPLAGDGARP